MDKVTFEVVSGKYEMTEEGYEENIKYSSGDLETYELARKEYDLNDHYDFNRITVIVNGKRVGDLILDIYHDE